MNMNQFTQKTMAALQRAQSLAMEYQHMQVEQEHLMLALTESGQWQRAADTAGAYHETWDETLSWLQMLINHEDGDSLSRFPLILGEHINLQN